jgi:glycosyltransferase involved in cell wall biosynthesis
MGILRTTKHKLTYRLLSAIPDAVIAVSEQVRRHCIDVDGIDEGRVHTIYNGLNLSDWKAKERSNRQEILSIATIGNIRYVKGHDLLIKAAAIVVEKYPNAHFAIAGEVLEQDYFDELTALVLRLNLTNNFQFLGPVEDLPKLLAGADVFVLPSRSEGFSNAIVEAMAASLAVVATNVGGNAEAVEEGVTGRLVPSESPELLAAALIDLIASPSTRNSMGCAGNARVRERFTTEAMMSRIASLYGTLLES